MSWVMLVVDILAWIGRFASAGGAGRGTKLRWVDGRVSLDRTLDRSEHPARSPWLCGSTVAPPAARPFGLGRSMGLEFGGGHRACHRTVPSVWLRHRDLPSSRQRHSVLPEQHRGVVRAVGPPRPWLRSVGNGSTGRSRSRDEALRLGQHDAWLGRNRGSRRRAPVVAQSAGVVLARPQGPAALAQGRQVPRPQSLSARSPSLPHRDLPRSGDPL